jgi:hypothetical protein
MIQVVDSPWKDPDGTLSNEIQLVILMVGAAEQGTCKASYEPPGQVRLGTLLA